MSQLTKRINEFFRLATKAEVKEVKDNIYITDHLEKVFDMFYLQHKDIEFIAYTTGCSKAKINGDLKLIREKISRIL